MTAVHIESFDLLHLLTINREVQFYTELCLLIILPSAIAL